MQKLFRSLLPALALAASLTIPSQAWAGFSIFFSHGWHGHYGKGHHRHPHRYRHRYKHHYGHYRHGRWHRRHHDFYRPPHAYGHGYHPGHHHGRGYRHKHHGKYSHQHGHGHKHGYRSGWSHDGEGRKSGKKVKTVVVTTDTGKKKTRTRRQTTSVSAHRSTGHGQTRKQVRVTRKVMAPESQADLLARVRRNVPGATLEEIAAARAGADTRRAGYIRESLPEFQAEDWGD